MKLKISLLNFVFLLMFWGPALGLLLYHVGSGVFSFSLSFATYDDYGIQLMTILLISFITFVLLIVLDGFFGFWSKLNYWWRYLLLMGIFILEWALIIFLSSQFIKMLGIYTGCQGGSPLLMFGLIFLYAPVGLVVTLAAWGIKTIKEASSI